MSIALIALPLGHLDVRAALFLLVLLYENLHVAPVQQIGFVAFAVLHQRQGLRDEVVVSGFMVVVFEVFFAGHEVACIVSALLVLRSVVIQVAFVVGNGHRRTAIVVDCLGMVVQNCFGLKHANFLLHVPADIVLAHQTHSYV